MLFVSIGKKKNTGRGGCGHRCYGFALLEWRTSNVARKKDIWTSIQNRNQKYSSTWYGINGEVDKKFTKSVWNTFTANPDNQINYESK